MPFNHIAHRRMGRQSDPEHGVPRKTFKVPHKGGNPGTGDWPAGFYENSPSRTWHRGGLGDPLLCVRAGQSEYEHNGGMTRFLRAEQMPAGRRTFRMVEGAPLRTRFGEGLYRTIFLEHALAFVVSPAARS